MSRVSTPSLPRPQGVIKRHAGPDCLGVCIEEPFSGKFSSVKALFPMLGAAILSCELAGLPYSTVHLSKLKIHATGKAQRYMPIGNIRIGKMCVNKISISAAIQA
jgi:hypothetical protein